MPEEFAAGDRPLSDQFFQAEVHRADDLVHDAVLVVQLEEEPVRSKGPLDWQPEFLLDRTHIVAGSHCFRFYLLALELAEDVGINCAKSVHFG